MRRLVAPKSVALVGASPDEEKISGRILLVLRRHGYTGRMYPVNPKYAQVQGLRCYPGLADLPETPDVAAVLVPNRAVPEVVEQAVSVRVPFVVVFSSGFNEISGEGQELAQTLRTLIQGTGTRLLGPNTEGFFDSGTGVALSFSPVIDPIRGRRPLRRGEIVVISQSGGLGFAVADQLELSGVGIRAVVTTGNELDLEVANVVLHYVGEPDVRGIVILVEGVNDLSAWRKVFCEARERGKKVLAVHVGRTPAGWRAVRAHTGKEPDFGREMDNLFRESEVQTFSDLEDLIDAVWRRPVEGTGGKRIAIVSTSGGGGIWTADLAGEYGLCVADPSERLTEELRSILPAYASLINPIDVTAQAMFDGTVAAAVEKVIDSGEFEGLLLVATFGYDHSLIEDTGFRRALAGAKLPVVVFSYTPPSAQARAFFASIGVPVFSSPRRAVRTLAALLYGAPETRSVPRL